MKYQPLNEVAELKSELVQSILAPLKKELNLHKKFLKETDTLFHSYVERINRIDSENGISKYINETKWLKEELFKQLSSEFPSHEDIKIEDYFQDFYSKIDTYLATVPEKITVEQEKKHYSIQPNDELFVSAAKPFKLFAYQITTLPKRVFNLFSKNKKQLTYWNRTIPLKQMGEHFYRNELIEMFLIKIQELELLKCEARSIRWQINKSINKEVSALLDKEEINFQELLEHLDELSKEQKLKGIVKHFNDKLKEWKLFAEELIDLQFKYFNQTKEIVGTLALEATKFTDSTTTTGHKQNAGRFQSIVNGWRNTEYAQIDDFQVDLELYHLKYTSLLQYYLLQGSCKTRVGESIAENIKGIIEEVTAVVDRVNKSSTLQDLKNSLVEESLKLNHLLKNKSIPLAIGKIYEHNFPQLLDRLEFKIREQLSEMKEKRIIYSKEIYDSPISKSNLSHFNPKELVEVDIFNNFLVDVQKIKSRLNGILQLTEAGLNDLTEIVNYNLDAAINSTDDEKLNLDDVKQIAKEGLERACAKTESLESELHGITELVNVTLKKDIDDFNTSLLKLTYNENITNLRIQLAKAKAVEKTKAYRKEILDKAKNFIPIALRFVKTKYNLGKNYLIEFQERIGLIERQSTLTHELSDFLSQTDGAIQKLPFVYRRLYEIKPLEEEAFFEGRTEEINQLDAAYTAWKSEKISSAVVVGEKGSGASSLINAFLRKSNTNSAIRHQLDKSISSGQDFLKFFDELFPNTTLDSFEATVEYLNNGNRKIIILEDIQHFFIKKPHGFQAINLLFELISQTAKNIFWLVGTTTFAWAYLQKTIAIERYIKHKIVLKPLSANQIVSLITKRHRVSGYNLEFRNLELTKIEKRKLNGLSKIQAQEIFRKAYFEELNEFAQSNISLALLYWLRSTDTFEENTVVIGKIKNIQFDFLNTLDKDSIFTLHALLLHESLTVSEHAEVFHQEEKQSRMTLMVLEDGGILKLKDGYYTINQLLYRQVVTVLKNKNLIH